MTDLAILAGIEQSNLPEARDAYYLQTIGVDIWKLRDIKPQKILVYLADVQSEKVLLKSQRDLLENILLSTNISRNNFDIMFADNNLNNQEISFNKYSRVIVMGAENTYYKPQNITISKLPALSNLLEKAADKKQVYLALANLN